jgi:hypothetical protein
MFTKPALSQIPLPTGWLRRVRSALVHSIALAQTSLTRARRVVANSCNARIRRKEENERLRRGMPTNHDRSLLGNRSEDWI